MLSCSRPHANASSQYLNGAKKDVVGGSTLGRLTVMLLWLAAQLAYWTRSTTDFHVGNELYSSKAHEVIDVSHLSRDGLLSNAELRARDEKNLSSLFYKGTSTCLGTTPSTHMTQGMVGVVPNTIREAPLTHTIGNMELLHGVESINQSNSHAFINSSLSKICNHNSTNVNESKITHNLINNLTRCISGPRSLVRKFIAGNRQHLPSQVLLNSRTSKLCSASLYKSSMDACFYKSIRMLTIINSINMIRKIRKPFKSSNRCTSSYVRFPFAIMYARIDSARANVPTLPPTRNRHDRRRGDRNSATQGQEYRGYVSTVSDTLALTPTRLGNSIPRTGKKPTWPNAIARALSLSLLRPSNMYVHQQPLGYFMRKQGANSSIEGIPHPGSNMKELSHPASRFTPNSFGPHFGRRNEITQTFNRASFHYSGHTQRVSRVLLIPWINRTRSVIRIRVGDTVPHFHCGNVPCFRSHEWCLISLFMFFTCWTPAWHPSLPSTRYAWQFHISRDTCAHVSDNLARIFQGLHHHHCTFFHFFSNFYYKTAPRISSIHKRSKVAFREKVRQSNEVCYPTPYGEKVVDDPPRQEKILFLMHSRRGTHPRSSFATRPRSPNLQHKYLYTKCVG